MKLNTKTNNKKLWYTLGAVALLIIAALSTYLFIANQNGSSRSDINLLPATEEQKEDAARTKEEFINKSESKDEAAPTANDARVIISSAEQSSDGSLRIGAIVQRTSGDGQCTATLKKDQATITRTSETVQQSGFLSCLDFVIPKAEIPSGTWQLTVSYSDSTASGTSDRQQVVIQ